MTLMRLCRVGSTTALIGAALLSGAGATAQSADNSTNAQAIHKAGQDYAKGDLESAWFRFWTLARNGDATAQYNLAQLYRQGRGIPVDLRLARYWYGEAAARGNGYAQFNLGMMYERGDGVPMDMVEAHAWYRRAAAQNVPEAVAALRRLEQTPAR